MGLNRGAGVCWTGEGKEDSIQLEVAELLGSR